MQQLAYWNGNLICDEELTISVRDVGFVQGVTVAEQLRTFGGQLFRLDEHMQRLQRSLQIIGIDELDLTGLQSQAVAMASHNHSLLQPGDDLGLTLFVTPGPHGPMSCMADSGPTVGMYTTPVPFHRWSAKYHGGEQLMTASVRQVPDSCWPTELKCRSRMHYYLADREVQQKNPNARALLLDQQGFLSEASTAGVLIYRADEGLLAPLPEKVLPSVSVGTVKELAQAAGISLTHRDLSPDEVRTADEVFLTSTSPCLLPVVSVDASRIGTGQPGEIFRRLMTAWSDVVGLDIMAQAERFSSRSC
ncbi:MAG: aminotransferase class IV [Fuerstiella sp.]